MTDISERPFPEGPDADDAAWQDLLRRCPDDRAPLELVGDC
jgi:hypothetical protein